MNETYMPRMPQVGERWRLRIRLGEYESRKCPYCREDGFNVSKGRAEENRSKYDGRIYEIIPLDEVTYCQNCWKPTPSEVGYVAINIFDFPNASRGIQVPYTWLEPLEPHS